MKTNLRKVEFDCFINNSNEWQNSKPTKGYFHQWGLIIINEINMTIGLVEDEYGKMYNVVPSSLKFIN